MARLKTFPNGITIYIYGEMNERHHGKHVLVVKSGEGYQYGFDGNPIKDSKALKSKSERIMIKRWILQHLAQLDQAWEDINNGVIPKKIDD